MYKIICPSCGSSDHVTYVQVQRRRLRYEKPAGVTEDGISTAHIGKLVSDEPVDSASNEDRFECSCGERWYEEFDDYIFADDELPDADLEGGTP